MSLELDLKENVGFLGRSTVEQKQKRALTVQARMRPDLLQGSRHVGEGSKEGGEVGKPVCYTEFGSDRFAL